MKYTTQELRDLAVKYRETLYPNGSIKFKQGSPIDLGMKQSSAMTIFDINYFLNFVDEQK